MARKWIINDSQFIISGCVEFHFELLGPHRKRELTIGGGRWEKIEEDNVILLYGTSDDFGSVTKEQFNSVFENTFLSPSWAKFTYVFSEKEWFKDALKEYQNSKEIANRLKQIEDEGKS